MKTYVYVDGFNLYYGAVKYRPQYKWLNVSALCRYLLPECDIQKIKYFTAEVKRFPDDPEAISRQQAFLRALRTLPNFEIIKGKFYSSARPMKLAPCDLPTPRSKTAYHSDDYTHGYVWRNEEKGSDVNLAVHAINDGYKGLYEAAVLLTNDSDLIEAVKIIKTDLKLKVGILNPHPYEKRSKGLHVSADFFRQITVESLRICQFLDRINDKKGVVYRPISWCAKDDGDESNNTT